MKIKIIALLFALPMMLISQEPMETSLPYYEIPAAPADFSAENVAARMIDGLGFRFYWASEGLREVDLAFKPSEESRTCGETIEHIYGLAKMINSTVKGQAIVRGEANEMNFEETRAETLLLLKEASDLLKGEKKLEELNLVFSGRKGNTEYPFWNLINGPIEDAVWHSGQVVSYRRSSGNPFNSKASVLLGKVRE